MAMLYATVDEALKSLIDMYNSYAFGYNFYSQRFYWSDYRYDYSDHLDRFPPNPDFFVEYMRKFRALGESHIIGYDHGECEEYADEEFLMALEAACEIYACNESDEDEQDVEAISKKIYRDTVKKLIDENLLVIKVDINDL